MGYLLKIGILALLVCMTSSFTGCAINTVPPTTSSFLKIHSDVINKQKALIDSDVQRAMKIADEFLLAKGFVHLSNPKRVWIERSPYGMNSLAIYELKDGSKVWWAELGVSRGRFNVGFYLERGGIAKIKKIEQIRDGLAEEFKKAFGKSRAGVKRFY